MPKADAKNPLLPSGNVTSGMYEVTGACFRNFSGCCCCTDTDATSTQATIAAAAKPVLWRLQSLVVAVNKAEDASKPLRLLVVLVLIVRTCRSARASDVHLSHSSLENLTGATRTVATNPKVGSAKTGICLQLDLNR